MQKLILSLFWYILNMELECVYCKKRFARVCTLNRHHRTATYCRKIQEEIKKSGKESFLHKCDECDLPFQSKELFEGHIAKCCKYQVNLATSQVISQHEKQIKELRKTKDTEIRNIKESHEVRLGKVSELLNWKDEELKSMRQELELSRTKIEMLKTYREELRDDFGKLVHTVASKPTSQVNTINNFPPLTQKHFEENAQYLSMDHVKKGVQGYAQYALDYPLRGRVKCTDVSRRKVKYKNEEGETVVDAAMTQLCRNLFSAIKDRNNKLMDEYVDELKSKTESGSLDPNKFYDIMIEIGQMNRDVWSASTGERPVSIVEFVKWVCNGLGNE